MGRRINPTWRRFGSEVRKYRKTAGISQGQLGREINVSGSLISYLEAGTRAPQFDQAQALDAVFKTSGTFERLWMTANNDAIYPAGARTAIDFEHMASEIREYHTILVPGLVQTASYARATYAAMRPFADDAALDRLVESRMKRQAVLAGDERPLVWMVLDEYVIRRILGDVVTMKEQLDHLLKLVEEHVIRLQVVSANHRLPPGISGPFKIFSFPDRPTVAAAEYVVDDLVIDDPQQVHACVTLFGAIQAEALSTGDSLDLVRRAKEELNA